MKKKQKKKKQHLVQQLEMAGKKKVYGWLNSLSVWRTNVSVAVWRKKKKHFYILAKKE